MIDITQDEITNFFIQAPIHRARHNAMKEWLYSGYALLDKISPNESVIDIGCGSNLFKPHLPNLVGVDPATDAADYKIPFLQFNTDQKFDVALCLGSVQFGQLDDIKEHLHKINSLLKPTGRIYWRCNERSFVPKWFFKWTFELHQDLSTEFGYDLKDCKWDHDAVKSSLSHRIYAEWVRKS
jgi:ubiquinone/menaquinone biosynthesis C-methylase UbiE